MTSLIIATFQYFNNNLFKYKTVAQYIDTTLPFAVFLYKKVHLCYKKCTF